MNLGDKQEASHLENSEVNQAGRDLTIYQGLQASDVIAIVKSVVSTEIAIYAQNAEIKAEGRLKEFSDNLVEKLAETVSDRLDRFNEPSVQFAVREAALGYVKSGSETDENNLIDLMIERVKVEEHTTKQKLIDQAIQIVPTLSAASLALLSLLAFRQLTFRGNKQDYLKWISSIDSVVNEVSRVGALDIEYLVQAGCATGMSGLRAYKPWEEDALITADLFFRHPAPQDAVNVFLANIGVQPIEGNKGFTTVSSGQEAQNLIMLLVNCFIELPSMNVGFNVVNSGTVNEVIQKQGLDSVLPHFQKFKDAALPFTNAEVKSFYEGLNSNWGKVIDLLNGERLLSFQLTPVGVYIGSRQLAHLSGREIPLDIFYH